MTGKAKRFGQTERLTIRIKQLIRNYTRGPGILKEFLQNADDAGADRVDVWIDWCDHRVENMPTANMQAFGGPALLISNNREFTAADIDAIQRIGEGSKIMKGSKTGRFGLGFNTAYNVTDHPSFVTADHIYCLDPHASAVTTDGTGESWPLKHAWQEFPDWPALFMVGGLAADVEHHAGSIFRLPLRDATLAAVSEISKNPFTHDDVEEILQLAGSSAASLLLFARHVLTLTITEVTRDGSRNRLRVQTCNPDEVQAARRPLITALGDDLKDSIHRWRGNPTLVPPLASWRHQIEIVVDAGVPRQETWQISAGLVRGAGERLLERALAMVENLDESAIPWVGTAARISSSTPSRASAVAGALHCTFSLPPPVALPIHVNGYFDLDDSRQRLTLATKDSGEAQRVRGGWNHVLLAEGCARAWVELLVGLAAQGVDGLYDLWPDPSKSHDPLIRAMIDGFYELAKTAPLIRVREHGSLRWTASAELRVLPARANEELQDALLADGLALPDPPLPDHVRRGLAPVELAPADLRRMLRDTPTFNGPLAEAPRASLRRPEWIEAMLVFCWSDGRQELADLPLALTSRDTLRSFGPASKKSIFLPEKTVQALFPDRPWLFLAPRLAKHVTEVKQANLLAMQPGHVIDLLKYVVGDDAVEWSQDAPDPPNGTWLARLFEYFAEHKLDAKQLAALRTRAILPGHDGRLHPAAERSPVLLGSAETQQNLLSRLRELGVVTVAVPPAAEVAFEAMLRRYPNLVTRVTGAAVVEALTSHAQALAGLDRKAAIDLLVWLASVELTTTDRSALARLPLLPTNTGLRRADAGVFLPAGFRPPPLGTAIDLVEVPAGCTSLVKQLGVGALLPHTFIEQQLVPMLASAAPDMRMRAWSWLRDELSAVLRGLDPAPAERLRRVIADLPAFPAADGSLRRVSALYDPESELVRDVLGDSAALPDLAAIHPERERWLEFLGNLGLAREPRLDDVLCHLRERCGKGLAAADSIHRVFKHLEKHWAAIAEREFPGGRMSVRQWLSQVAWLPPVLTSSGPGFVAPEPRLHVPSELYTDVALVGSQAPVCAWTVESKMADAIGLRRHPPPTIVLRHFEHILDTFSDTDDVDATARHVKALTPIYRYLDRLHQARERRVEPQPAASQDELALRELLRRRRCVWDLSTLRAWIPSHVFIEDVRRLEPLRARVPARIPEGAVRYLGGKQRPEAEDYREWLRDLAADLAGEVLAPEQRLHVLFALRNVGDPAQDEDLPLLCTDARLRPASMVFVDDAPWLKERPADLFCVDPEVPISLVLALRVQGVAGALQEHLHSVDSSGVTAEALQACAALQARMRAPEFAAGVRRLVRHTHGPDADPDLAFLGLLSLRPASRLQTRFVLRGREIASVDARHFFQAVNTTLMLVGQQESRLVSYVARTVHRLLGADAYLADTAPLEHILSCDPATIDEVLDDDRILDITYEEHPDDSSESLPEAAEQLLGEIDPETMVDPTDSEATIDQSPTPPAAASSAPAAAPRRFAAASTGDGYKSGLARIAAMIEDPPAQPHGRSVEAGGLSIPRRDGSNGFGAVEGILPGLRARGLSSDGIAEEVTREIEEQALTFVMAEEVEAGRDPERMAKDHPGYNILSRDPATRAVLRIIEVKGTRRDWRDQPIRLTMYQILDALKDPARSWLYVVERLDGTPRSRKIPAFVEHIVGFTVDAASWAPLAESAPAPTQPREGFELWSAAERVGTIRSVHNAGTIVLLNVELPDGTLKKVPFRPSEHHLKEVDDGEDVP